MHTVSQSATVAKTAPLKLSSDEKARVTAAQAELSRLDGLLMQVVNLKATIKGIGVKFASGEVDIIGAAAILTTSAQDRHALQQALKPHLKGAQRDVIASAGDLVTKARQHHMDELKKLAASIEKQERETQARLGVHDDEFSPSPALCGLREQHRRFAATLDRAPSRTELNALVG